MYKHEKDIGMQEQGVSLTELAAKHKLSPDEYARLCETEAGDPVADYVGFPEIQIDLILSERIPGETEPCLGREGMGGYSGFGLSPAEMGTVAVDGANR